MLRLVFIGVVLVMVVNFGFGLLVVEAAPVNQGGYNMGEGMGGVFGPVPYPRGWMGYGATYPFGVTPGTNWDGAGAMPFSGPRFAPRLNVYGFGTYRFGGGLYNGGPSIQFTPFNRVYRN